MMMRIVKEDCKNAISFGCKNHPNMNCLLCEFYEPKDLEIGVTYSNIEDNSWVVINKTDKIEEELNELKRLVEELRRDADDGR